MRIGHDLGVRWRFTAFGLAGFLVLERAETAAREDAAAWRLDWALLVTLGFPAFTDGTELLF